MIFVLLQRAVHLLMTIRILAPMAMHALMMLASLVVVLAPTITRIPALMETHAQTRMLAQPGHVFQELRRCAMTTIHAPMIFVLSRPAVHSLMTIRIPAP